MADIENLSNDMKCALQDTIGRQRTALAASGWPTLAERKQRLLTLERLVERSREAFVATLNEDFGGRAREETLMVDINGTLASIRYARKNLRHWMAPERRHTTIWFLPGSNKVVSQPLGVVGIMSPWNYPVQLSLAPAAAALAAGNSIMLKPSEVVPRTSALMARLIGENFSPDVFAVVNGDASVAEAFSALTFDHLLFTGSTATGRRVMQAAAQNLVPVTLELGGKSPAIVDSSYSLAEAAKRIAWGKMFNAGQTCVAPDYAIVPAGSEEAFARHAIEAVRDMYGDIGQSPDYSSLINERQAKRLAGLVAEAEQLGASVISAETSKQDPRRIPLTIVLNPPPDSAIMQEEIFGPVLPVVGSKSVADAINMVNSSARPLALYFFSKNGAQRRDVLNRTRSGGVTLNDTLLHYLQDDLPFGGIGGSGMGRYHGREGFDTFSHKRSVFTQRGFGNFTGAKLLYPPYGSVGRMLLAAMRR